MVQSVRLPCVMSAYVRPLRFRMGPWADGAEGFLNMAKPTISDVLAQFSEAVTSNRD